MKITMRNLLILTLGLTLGVSLTIGHGVFANRDQAATAPLPLKELRTFIDVFANIKGNYVEDVDDRTLIDNAVRGMLAGLDPHSAYLDSEAYKDLQVGTSGEFGGLGIEVGMEDGFVKVIAPIDDTPAQRAGVAAGDMIVRLNDTPVKGLTLKEAVDIMRGKPGTDITLTIVREGHDGPIRATITRAVIKVRSVKSRMLEDGFGYLRITQFQSGTGDNLIEAVEALKKENGGKLKGVVLDLRNNPGGVLNAAVDVSDAFLRSGMIVYTEGRNDSSRIEFKATPRDVLDDARLVFRDGGFRKRTDLQGRGVFFIVTVYVGLRSLGGLALADDLFGGEFELHRFGGGDGLVGRDLAVDMSDARHDGVHAVRVAGFDLRADFGKRRRQPDLAFDSLQVLAFFALDDVFDGAIVVDVDRNLRNGCGCRDFHPDRSLYRKRRQ